MDKNERKLIRGYLDGNTPDHKSKQAKKYLVSHRNDDSLNDMLAEEWNVTAAENRFQINTEENWNEIEHYVKQTKRQGVFTLLSRKTMTLAAGLVLVLLSFGVVTYFNHQPLVTDKVEYTIKQTKKGEKLNVTLPDGTTIRLNSSTELRIPSNYSTAKDRLVQLDGEAFFSVSKFEGKPFKVITEGVTTEVLGTSFNVNVNPDTGNTTVAVVTGKVKVSTKRSDILLYPSEMTAVSKESINLKKVIFDYDEVIGWNDNLLVFNDVEFDDVVASLEEWYGVEFVIEGQPESDATYNGRFENISLQYVLEGLGFSSSFQYEIKGKTVFLKF